MAETTPKVDMEASNPNETDDLEEKPPATVKEVDEERGEAEAASAAFEDTNDSFCDVFQQQPMEMVFPSDCEDWDSSINNEETNRCRKNTDCSKHTQSTAASSFNEADEAAVIPLEKKHFKHESSLDPCDEVASDDSSTTTITLSMPSYLQRVKRFIGCVLVFGLICLLMVLIGAKIEERKYGNAPSTEFLYSGDEVCGMTNVTMEDDDANNATIATQSYNSSLEAHEAGDVVGHCGDCGHCSDWHDMNILAETREILTDVTARCAFKIFIGKNSVRRCMEERVGFTPECNECWLENIECSFQNCKFTCFKYKLFRQDNNEGDSGELSHCLMCDERMCGPQFLSCSGSNRRRMGIVSDIGRDAQDEQCQQADIDWLQVVQLEE